MIQEFSPGLSLAYWPLLTLCGDEAYVLNPGKASLLYGAHIIPADLRVPKGRGALVHTGVEKVSTVASVLR